MRILLAITAIVIVVQFFTIVHFRQLYNEEREWYRYFVDVKTDNALKGIHDKPICKYRQEYVDQEVEKRCAYEGESNNGKVS